MKTTIKLFANPSTEAQHQINVIRWSEIYRTKYPELKLLFHVPNGGSRDAIEGKHLKEQGVKPGVPDLCLPVPRGPYHGLYIEMKTEVGHTSPDQDWWGEELLNQKYMWEVCHGWKEAIQVLEKYLALSVPR